ncbi:MAG: hypothetical protein QM820_13125 [Minicystis sp.]
MTLKVRVSWANAGTTLLPEALADIGLDAGGAALSVTSKTTGAREFEVPDGTSKVTLKAQFSAKLGPVGSEPEMQRVVWRAEQPYDVINGGTELQPVNLPQYVKGHPLVETHAAAGVNGAALIRLRTEFVNITPFWLAFAEHAPEYVSEHHPKANLVVLGYTGGDPKIWFASFNDLCLTPPKPGISCLVFFRPSSYTYTKVDQVHSMFGLNRFLLKPVDDPHADFWKRDVFNLHGPAGKEELYAWIRCGFEDALDRAGKPVVMLHPWPSGINFGEANGAGLPRLAEAAVRFLWAEQRIAKNLGAIHLGRLGISGYSAGGSALWAALGANADRVNEVYSFDAVGARGAAPQVMQWFQKNSNDRCLRMSSGHQIAAHEAIRLGIEKLVGKTSRVSSGPPSAKGYDAGVNPLWDHVVSEVEATVPIVRTEPAFWHQFAVFGGYIAFPGPLALTFLQQFLRDSDF